MVIIPYIVLAAVAALFFAVSYFIICGFPMKHRKAEDMENGEEEKKGLPDLEKEKKPPVHKAAPVDDATRIIPVKPKRPAPVRFDEEEEEKTKVFTRKDFGESKARDAFSAASTGSPFPPEKNLMCLLRRRISHRWRNTSSVIS